MSLMDQIPVMDVSPWPNGRGFSGARSWWDYIRSKEERQRLDNLMGVALLDDEVCERLVSERDDALLAAFGLSEKTRNWLHDIQASSLDELAQAIVAGS
jgi:hypothetical protein